MHQCVWYFKIMMCIDYVEVLIRQKHFQFIRLAASLAVAVK